MARHGERKTSAPRASVCAHSTKRMWFKQLVSGRARSRLGPILSREPWRSRQTPIVSWAWWSVPQLWLPAALQKLDTGGASCTKAERDFHGDRRTNLLLPSHSDHHVHVCTENSMHPTGELKCDDETARMGLRGLVGSGIRFCMKAAFCIYICIFHLGSFCALP